MTCGMTAGERSVIVCHHGDMVAGYDGIVPSDRKKGKTMADYLVRVVATYEIEVEVNDAESVADAEARGLDIAMDLEQYSVCVADLATPFGFDNYEVTASINLDEE